MTTTIGILVTFERPEDLEAHLDALSQQTRPPDALIVIDNAPSFAAKALVQSARIATEYVAADDNLGPAGGLALGQQLAMLIGGDDDWLVLLDDDNPPWAASQLEDLLRSAQLISATDVVGIGIAGARLSRFGRLMKLGESEIERGGLIPVDYLGGNQLPHYRLGAVREVGPFRSDLFFGCEELEFGLRLKASGYSLVSHADWLAESRRQWATARALGGPEPAPWRQYYNARNGVRVLLDGASTAAAVGFAVSQLAGAARSAARARSFREGPSARVRGLRDGLRSSMGRTVQPGGKSIG